MGKRLGRGDKNKMAVVKRKGKRELMRESFKDFVEEFADRDILRDLKGEEVNKNENVEEGGKTEKTCRCNVKDEEDCICYFYSKKRVKELEEKMGRENFLKKRLVDELTQILIEYDC
jgi:hypothetical protein